MANYNQITFIRKIIRGLLKDGLQNNGRKAYPYVGLNTFTLNEDYPDSTSIVVYKNGIVMSSGWTYNATTNVVMITASLTGATVILITFSYYDKYSDNEILDYIESSLSLFAIRDYVKLFRLSSDRTEVQTVDGVNPTLAECYLIATMTAINIDPNNVAIRTKEFSIDAEEQLSKSELIDKTFQAFTGGFLGEYSFSETLEEEI